MDRERACKAFDTYVASYDADNPRIALKVDHTLRVAQICERIALGIGLPPEDVNLAWLVGILHDVGRFEQVKRYNTFSDAASVSHAALGASLLFEDGRGTPLLRTFIEDDADDALIKTAVETHSDYRLPEGLDERTRTLCDVLRDADKVDIIKVCCLLPIEDVYGVSEADLLASEVSPACVDVFYEHRCLPGRMRVHPADKMVSTVCFAWELVYPASLEAVRKEGYLLRILSRSWENPETQRTFDAMRAHMQEALSL